MTYTIWFFKYCLHHLVVLAIFWTFCITLCCRTVFSNVFLFEYFRKNQRNLWACPPSIIMAVYQPNHQMTISNATPSPPDDLHLMKVTPGPTPSTLVVPPGSLDHLASRITKTHLGWRGEEEKGRQVHQSLRTSSRPTNFKPISNSYLRWLSSRLTQVGNCFMDFHRAWKNRQLFELLVPSLQRSNCRGAWCA